MENLKINAEVRDGADEWISIDQAVKMTGLNPNTIRSRLERSFCVKKRQRLHYLYLREDVERVRFVKPRHRPVDENWITLAEAAEKYEMLQSTIYARLRKHQLERKKNGGYRLFRASDVEKILTGESSDGPSAADIILTVFGVNPPRQNLTGRIHKCFL